MYERIMKTNPYHDPHTGKFASRTAVLSAGATAKAPDAAFRDEHQTAAGYHEARAKELGDSLWDTDGQSFLSKDLMTPERYSQINAVAREHKEAAHSHRFAAASEKRDDWKGASKSAREDSKAAFDLDDKLG